MNFGLILGYCVPTYKNTGVKNDEWILIIDMETFGFTNTIKDDRNDKTKFPMLHAN